MFEYLVFQQRMVLFKLRCIEIECWGIVGLIFLNVYPLFDIFEIICDKNVQQCALVLSHS